MLLVFSAAPFGKLNSGQRRECAQRFAELQVLALHEPVEGRTALVAAEAVPGLRLRPHVERWGLFGVEGAQAAVIGADALELDTAANELDQIDARLDLFRDGTHGISRGEEYTAWLAASSGRKG